jgi:hypothetical protein
MKNLEFAECIRTVKMQDVHVVREGTPNFSVKKVLIFGAPRTGKSQLTLKILKSSDVHLFMGFGHGHGSSIQSIYVHSALTSELFEKLLKHKEIFDRSNKTISLCFSYAVVDAPQVFDVEGIQIISKVVSRYEDGKPIEKATIQALDNISKFDYLLMSKCDKQALENIWEITVSCLGSNYTWESFCCTAEAIFGKGYFIGINLKKTNETEVLFWYK